MIEMVSKFTLVGWNEIDGAFDIVGVADGATDGVDVGSLDGYTDGAGDGAAEGWTLGAVDRVGLELGAADRDG